MNITVYKKLIINLDETLEGLYFIIKNNKKNPISKDLFEFLKELNDLRIYLDEEREFNNDTLIIGTMFLNLFRFYFNFDNLTSETIKNYIQFTHKMSVYLTLDAEKSKYMADEICKIKEIFGCTDVELNLDLLDDNNDKFMASALDAMFILDERSITDRLIVFDEKLEEIETNISDINNEIRHTLDRKKETRLKLNELIDKQKKIKENNQEVENEIIKIKKKREEVDLELKYLYDTLDEKGKKFGIMNKYSNQAHMILDVLDYTYAIENFKTFDDYALIREKTDLFLKKSTKFIE